MSKLEAFVLLGVEVQKTWGGVMSNLKDRLLDLGSTAVQPLFNDFKTFATDVINFIGSPNKTTKMFEFSPEALAIANTTATVLHKTWLAIVGTVQTFGNIIASFETPLILIGKLVGMILDGWGALLYVVFERWKDIPLQESITLLGISSISIGTSAYIMYLLLTY